MTRGWPLRLLVSLMICVVAAACSGVKTPPPQRDGDWEIAIRRVERVGTEWTNRSGRRQRAREGGELVVVTLSFSALSAEGEDLVVPPILLTDDAGQTYSGLDELHLLRSAAAKSPSEVLYTVGVKKGARVVSARIRNLTFTLR
jgi:hypothetical protein